MRYLRPESESHVRIDELATEAEMRFVAKDRKWVNHKKVVFLITGQ